MVPVHLAAAATAADSSNVIFYTLAFIVPGFLLNWTISMFVPQRKESEHLLFLRFLTFSCINYAVWCTPIYYVLTTNVATTHPRLVAALWGVITFVSPVGLGIAFSTLNRFEWLRRGLQKLGFNPIHSIPSAWDFKFVGQEHPCWIVVTLKDGGIVRGRFGAESFASSDPGERDIFIEEMYRDPGNGEAWARVLPRRGILVPAGQIRHIEFLP